MLKFFSPLLSGGESKGKKRAREDESEAETTKWAKRHKVNDRVDLSKYTKDPEWYLRDGNIILNAGDQIFCVHRNKITQWEGGLQLLFDRAGKSKKELPFCHVPDMPPTTLSHFLTVCYGHPRRQGDDDNRLADLVRIAGSCLYIGTTYDTPYLLDYGSSILMRVFRPPGADDVSDKVPPYGRVEPQPTLPPSTALRGIWYARTYGLPLILPKACYYLANLPIGDILELQKEDNDSGSDAVLKLDEKTVLKILQGRDRLLWARRHTFLRWINTFTNDGKPRKPSALCTEKPQKGGDTCFQWMLRMQLNFNHARTMEVNSRALEAIPAKALQIMKSHLCVSCGRELDKQLTEGEIEIMRQLPMYFGFGRWRKLLRKQMKVFA